MKPSDFNDNDDARNFLARGGEMGERVRAFDWAKTPLGPVEHWPQSLRTSVSICLNSQFPINMAWGPDLVILYNDAFIPILGAKHPHQALGVPNRECFREIWSVIGPMLEGVLKTGRATWSEDLLLPLDRSGYLEECYFTFSYSPIRDESGGVGGVFIPVKETTEKVITERRLSTLRELAARGVEPRTVADACRIAADTLHRNPYDFPFVCLYLQDGVSRRATLAAARGIEVGTSLSAPSIDLDPTHAGRPAYADAVLARRTEVFAGQSLGPLPEGVWKTPPEEVVLIPLSLAGQSSAYGFLIAGVNARKRLDADYRRFLDLVAGQIADSISAAQTYEEEKKRADALAELDRAKTVFFSNVSHEFRTPLTLMLGPQEDALRSPGGALAGEELRSVHRNTLRLLKLVNSLLDFSRIEAGRMQASFEPVDLAVLTRDLASPFRAAIEQAGVRFEADCPPLSEPVYVDRDMWEKIVLNLLSNAFKFTFEGSITVSLREQDGRVELRVADTGVGIPPGELARVFERFHRIEGTRARTHEGSGIGLALVHDLVGLQGGKVDVTSTVGRGTTFAVSLPLGAAHLPADRVGAPRSLTRTEVGAETFVEEALRWQSQDEPRPARRSQARVLFADDNADMREYVARLLGEHWAVQTVSDGAQALARAQQDPPDLILTDVMMPNLDGFALLRALREDPRTAQIPVIMLSARAGEESRVEGLGSGADDYLIKPFSARELVARVRVQLDNVRLQRAADDATSEADRARARAEAANRTKDEFLAMLGHELRNPISPIITATQLMRMRGMGGRELQIIERQLGQLVRLVDDLLDISRITRGKVELRKQPLELASVALRGLEMASPLLEQRHQTVDLDILPEGLLVEADPDRLAQVVSNLLTNAGKYSEPGSTIHVTGKRTKGRVALAVRDHGIGIAPQMLERVFDIFVQQPQALDRAKGGLGLGLAIVRSLVELHGGTVSAMSEGEGKGSEFVVELPLAPGACDSVPAPPRRHAPLTRTPAVASGKARVLVVDDNPDATATLAEVLTLLGYDVKVAHDGPAALDIARTFEPSVCVLDIGLPVMDGYELARRLRQVPNMPRDLRLIAVTGYGQDADRRRSRDAGFNGHLVKPVNLDVLTKAVAGN